MEYTISLGTPAAATVAPVTPSVLSISPTSVTSPAGEAGEAAPVQAALSGFEGPAPHVTRAGSATVAARPARAASATGSVERRGPRHRYWSMRDLSRRIWVGRGYALLRGLIRAGILPATRSTQSWWIDDADVQGLTALFQDRAGKVRAFHALDKWLRERCYVAPLTEETVAMLEGGRLGFAWRGHVYLPKRTWRVDFAPDGLVTYFHATSSATVPPTELAAAA